MPQIDDQQRSAGEHPRGNINVHQHFERGHETENCRHPDELEYNRAEHGGDGRLERLVHAAERRAFDLIGGGETVLPNELMPLWINTLDIEKIAP